ncbi:MAG: SPOR domain-containing protein [Cypionkella sp.]|nr:SPOR domain-containing protein [Cypionkella sp.]
MSDARYAPYGADDDPFLTHPAGAGQARGAGQHPQFGQPSAYWGGDRGYSDPTHHHADHGYGEPAHTDHSIAARYAPQTRVQQADHSSRYRDADAAAYGHADRGYAQTQSHRGYEMPSPQDYPADHAPPPSYTAAPRGNFIARHNTGAQTYDSQPHHYDPAPLSPPVQDRAREDQRPASYRPASFAAPPRVEPRAEPQQTYPQPAHLRGPVAYAPQPMHHAQDTAHYTAPRDVVGLAAQTGGLMQWAGAICTIAVVVGATLWGYELAVRDANGIPVVRAAVGPLRIAPETPGGEISAHQGLAVNAIPAAGGAAVAVPDQITLAPQTATLAPQDLGATIIEDGSFVQTSGAGSAAALQGASDMLLSMPETSGGIGADLTALPDALPEDMPMTDAEAVERALEAALAEGGYTTADSTQAPEPISMSTTDPVAPPTAEINPANIAIGTPMVQLGAFDSDATARAEWASLQTRFTELMAGKALVVEPAKSGGRDFYRLRAHGFASADDTRRFCAAVLAENGSCFPVDQR